MSPLVLLALAVIALVMLFGYVAYRVRTQPAARKPQLHHPPGGLEPPYHLPESYGENHIVAMAKNPEWLYAYWEVTPTRQEEYSRANGPGSWEVSRPLLRVYDVTGREVVDNHALITDIPINDFAKSWYIHVGKPRGVFYIDLGRMKPDGTFITLCRSNKVQTPAREVSSVIDPEWPPIDAVWGTFRLGTAGPHGFKPGDSPSSPGPGVSSASLFNRKE